jgi:hypothetical protein
MPGFLSNYMKRGGLWKAILTKIPFIIKSDESRRGYVPERFCGRDSHEIDCTRGISLEIPVHK